MSDTPLYPHLLARLQVLADRQNLSTNETLHALLNWAETQTDIQIQVDQQALLNSLADGYLIVGQQGQVLHLHDTTLGDMLQEQGDTRNDTLIEAMQRYTQDIFEKRYLAVFETQHAFEFIDYNPVLGRWMQNWVFPHDDILYVYYRDVNDQVQQEQRLLASEQRLKWLIDNVPVIVYTTDADGVFTSSSGKSLAKLGLEEDEVVGQDVFELYQDFPEVINGVRRVLQGETVHFVGEVHGIPFESWYLPQYDKNSNLTGMMGISIDLTEQKRLAEAEEQHAALKAELAQSQEMNALKTRFMNMVSHEFRTPLTIIRTSAEILQRYEEKLDKSRRSHHLSNITGQVNNLQSVLEDVEQALSVHINPPPPYPESLVAADLVVAVLANYPKATRSRIESVIEGMPRPIHADRAMLQEMLAHLIDNALAYSPDDSTVRIQQAYNQSVLRLTVQDEGMGISQDDQKHIFEPFFRGNNADTVPGTGLGLSLVRHVVDAHAGHLQISSQPNQGTTIRIYLPCVDWIINEVGSV